MKAKAKVIRFPDTGAAPELEPEKQLVLSPDANETPADKKLAARLDQLTPSQLQIYSENLQIYAAYKGGMEMKAALRLAGSKRSPRSARDLVKRCEKKGRAGALDKRWSRVPATSVMTQPVRDIALAWYFERSAAGPRAIAELTAETCREKGLPIPSESSIKRFLIGLSSNIKLARRGSLGLQNWQRQNASVVEQQKTTFANELWQADDTPPEIFVKRLVRGEWDVAPVYFSAFLDDFSRACPGIIVSTKPPDAWTLSILSYLAFNEKENPRGMVSGPPCGIETDRGANYVSKAVRTSWQCIGITHIVSPPRYPNAKGKVERFFRTIDSNLLRKLPGHHDAIGKTPGAARKRIHELLTIEQLREAVYDWVVNKYHQTVHSETGRKPIELWEETVRYRPVESREDLNIFLLQYNVERTILNCGIRLTIDDLRHRYWSPEFDSLSKRRVAIRYNPEDLRSVLVYCAKSGEFLCEAWDMRGENPKYTFADVQAARTQQKDYLRGLQRRQKDYYRDVLKNDRIVERQKEWREAREIVETLPKPETDSAEDNALELLINAFRQNDRTRK